ncbi:hydroxymethylglutaryl-CoA reductase, degradative [Candidatus Bathyarchaeota archaeon]|nr:MAG: hydroxymethylglutaryl-CoA reductase, degradative [Candidatus Bathyarchaeota archaeon]
MDHPHRPPKRLGERPQEIYSLVPDRIQQTEKGKPRSTRGLALETPVLNRRSTIASFYKLPLEERLRMVKEFASLTSEEAQTLANGSMPIATAQRMIENVISIFPIPLGIATNFLVNGRDYLVPMAIEEPSVVAAASNAAKMARPTGGFTATSTEPVMISQIQIVKCPSPKDAEKAILSARKEILEKANQQDPTLLSLGGGAKDLRVRILPSQVGIMVIAELLVDCRDAMGANVANTMAEAVAPMLENVSKGQARLRIISNLADKRIARATVTVSKDALGGEDIVDGIVEAYAFAAADPYRCATHNKGVMNGVTAVCLATGNDTRAIEAGAHAYAARSGHYSPLTIWKKDSKGNLVGTIEIPAAVGIIGGVTAVHPIAKISLKILGVKTARELGEVMASVGLAQNMAALRALAAEGIQKGHMSLHARNIAAMAGAQGDLIDLLADKMVAERKIRLDRARELLLETSKSKESRAAQKKTHKA